METSEIGAPVTIFLTINHGINVRDLLRTDVFRTLRESGHRLVVLSPAADDPEFVREFAGGSVTVERLVRQKAGRLEQALNSWRIKLFPELSASMRILAKPRIQWSAGKRLGWQAITGLKRVIGARRFGRLLLAALATWFPDRQHRALFDRYRPDLVVVTEVFGLAPDWWIWKEARRRRIPTAWLVRSWDNLTTKGVLPVVDRLVVWSEDMRQDAVRMFGYDPEHVHVAGTPHFDVMLDEPNLPGRAAFFTRIGGDPRKALITFALAPLTRDDLDFELRLLEELAGRAREGRFAVPCQVLARTYPLRGYDIRDRLGRIPGLLVDVPGRESPVFHDRELTLDDVRHAGATLRYSSVVVNVASTFALEAAVCGTPAICTAFEFEPKDYLVSHVRYFDHDHYRKLMATGGVRVARSLDDLTATIDAFLREPGLDAAARRRVGETLSYRVDGHAGERVGKFLVQLAGEVAARR